MSINAIEIKELTKNYGDFALDGLNLCLPQGCIMGLVGENGAGKSTTIKLLLGLIESDGGSACMYGSDGKPLSKEDIGAVIDDMGLSACLTPKKLGKVMSNLYANWDAEAYAEYIKKFSLPENKKYGDFSRGMKMKLMIAVALSHNAKLLILDEATSGLDPVVRDEILDIFLDFTRDESHSVLLSSHIVSDLEKICDYIAFLHGGRLMLCEEKDVLRDSYGILHMSTEQFDELDRSAVCGKKKTPYGVEAIVRRDSVPHGLSVSPVDIEQLFIFMTKEEREA